MSDLLRFISLRPPCSKTVDKTILQFLLFCIKQMLQSEKLLKEVSETLELKRFTVSSQKIHKGSFFSTEFVKDSFKRQYMNFLERNLFLV